MNRREVYKFFDIKEKVVENLISEEYVDELFLSCFDNWTEEKGSIALYLISRYRRTYNEEFKAKSIAYLSMTLLDPFIIQQEKRIQDRGSLILLDKITDGSFSNESLQFFDIIEEITIFCDQETSKSIIIPMLYECSASAATYRVHDFKFQVFLDNFRSFLTIKKVRDWFKEGSLWGLNDSSIPVPNNCFYSFCYETNVPCVLDGFFEIFLYESREFYDGVDVFHKENRRMDNLDLISKGIEIMSTKLYDIVMSLIKSDAKTKNNFIKYVLLSIRQNLDRNKMVFDVDKTISDGYAYNMNNLLALLCARITKDELFELIDLNFFHQIELRGISEEEPKKTDEKSEFLYETFEPNAQISFSTVIFMTKIVYLNFSHVKFHSYYKDLSGALDALDSQANNPLFPQAAAQSEQIKSKIECFSYLKFISFFKDNEVPIIDFMIKLANLKGVEKLPELFFEIIFTLQNDIYRYHDPYVSPSLISLIEKVMDLTKKNLHFKSDVIAALDTKNVFLTEKLFSQLIIFYSDVYKIDEFFYDQKKIRYEIHNIMLKDTSQQLRDMKITKENLRFVNYMIDDFQSCLQNGLDAIVKIKEFTAQLSQISNVAEKKAVKKKLVHEKRVARSSFAFVKSSLQLLQFLIDETGILLRNEVIKKFISILNCNLRTIAGPKCNNLIIDSPQKIGFQPKVLLRSILKIYLAMDDKKFLEAIVCDHSYFNISLFKRVLKIVVTKPILSNDEVEEFRKIVEELEKLQIETLEEDDIVPEEFIDPITCETMEDPVLLLTSKVIVDRSTFDSIMLADQIDPFNREKLDESKVKEATELKAKIEAFFNDKKKKSTL